ncbi:hemerythrin domain-containing protein [Pseudohoeflea suaedae]|uniref:hemerythrin domain-containing protein n=1 Tax=Pseudohoeflea suaedae TaxID=877384 RepID=UPI001FCED0D2|nr:hemerythrin domain-containing protein [Pseudohoeflea suaedae]
MTDLVATFFKAKTDQLALCDQLEEIADSLPDRVNRQKCLYAAAALAPMIRKVHQFEEEILFPRLAVLMSGEPTSARTLERLRFEHCEDECFAEELTEALFDLGRGRVDLNVEATGYMLRGFFEAVRRHIAAEQEIVQRCSH